MNAPAIVGAMMAGLITFSAVMVMLNIPDRYRPRWLPYMEE